VIFRRRRFPTPAAAPPPAGPPPPPQRDLAEEAAALLMESEAWPPPSGLLGLLRRALGRPETDGTDDLAMRADADRLGDHLADERETDEPQVHPGFLGLVSRSGQRMARRTRRRCGALATALARHTEAQATLDRCEYDRGVVARQVDELPPLPDRPRLGVALTRPWAVWLLMLLVLIPLEGILTYQQILILGLDVNLTKAFAALIGAALTVSAEVLGTFLAHVGSRADSDRRSVEHRGTYWMAAALACLTAVVAVATISTLATSRDANQQIVEQRRQQIEQLDRQFARPGFTSDGTSGRGSQAVLQEQGDAARINLAFTFWLQLLGLLAAVGLGLRRRLAEDYQAVVTLRRTTLRRAQLSELRVSRGERNVTRRAGRQERIMRDIRSLVEDEYRFLESLFQRGLQRYRAAAGRVAADRPLPVLPDLEDVIRHFIEPELQQLAQPRTGSVPQAEPPPPPADWERPPPRPRPAWTHDEPRPRGDGAPHGPRDEEQASPGGRTRERTRGEDPPQPAGAPDGDPARRTRSQPSEYDADTDTWGSSGAEPEGGAAGVGSEYDVPPPPWAPSRPSEYDAPPASRPPSFPPPTAAAGYNGPAAPPRPVDADGRDVYDTIERMRAQSAAPSDAEESVADAGSARNGILRGVRARLRRPGSRPAGDDDPGAAAPRQAPRAHEAGPDRSAGEQPAVAAAPATPPPRPFQSSDPDRWRRLAPPGSIHPDAPYRDALERLAAELAPTSGDGRDA
jgi:hypothetical protein